MPASEQSTEKLIKSKDEIRKAISLLKSNKAPGSDLITTEVLKTGGEPIINMLHLIFLKAVNTENTSLYFSKMLVNLMFLRSIPGKVFNMILVNKIREKTEVYTSERQYGFRPNRGTVDAIFIVRQLMKKPKEKGINCHYHFVAFRSTFDTTWREALWKMMRSIGINTKIVRIVEKMYDKTICAVVVDDLLTEWISVSVGVRQGFLLSPTLFTLFLDS